MLGRAEPALHHAGRCLELCEKHAEDMEDWDLPFACEALARAHLVAGDDVEVVLWRARAIEAGAAIAGEEDRAILETDLGALDVS